MLIVVCRKVSLQMKEVRNTVVSSATNCALHYNYNWSCWSSLAARAGEKSGNTCCRPPFLITRRVVKCLLCYTCPDPDETLPTAAIAVVDDYFVACRWLMGAMHHGRPVHSTFRVLWLSLRCFSFALP